MKFDEAVTIFRARESQLQALPLLQTTTDYTRIFVVWGLVGPCTRLTAKERKAQGLSMRWHATDEALQWDWLWSHVRVDERKLADSAGIGFFKARAAVGILKAHRLVYPDNTYHLFGATAANARVVERLLKKS